MLGQASNPMLAQAAQGIQSNVPANLQGALSKVVHAGLTIMYSPKLAQQRNAHMASSKDPAQDAGQGASRLISNLYQQSNKTLPIPLIVPAAMIFAFEYLDLVAKAGKAQITPDLLAQTTQAVSSAVLPLMGVTPDKLQQMVAMAKQKQAGGAAQAAPAVPPTAQPASSGIINGAGA
jgi:hypothetical protein